MKAKHFGLESICIISKAKVTLACNVMFEGNNYSEPIYTNVFCDLSQLISLLNTEEPSLLKAVKIEIKKQIQSLTRTTIQIDLPDFINGKQEWIFPGALTLIKANTNDIPFQCYTLGN